MLGHWTTVLSRSPDDFGFVYVITNLLNSRKYIGKKVFHFHKKKKTVESDWKTYTGSSKTLNADILTYGKEHFSFEIIKFCKSRAELSYQEVREILGRNAIFSDDYYNEMVHIRLRHRKSLVHAMAD